MQANPALGVLLHAIGGLAAASFYLPYKGIQKWSWESYWIIGGFFSWIIAPIVLALIICPDFWGVIQNTPVNALFWTYLFGLLWGIGGLTFGLSMRFLGLSLGYAIALGFSAAFGTIIPPIFFREFIEMLSNHAGQVTMLGVAVSLGGIAVCGLAGMRKEAELSEEEKTASIKEFSLIKGLWVALFAGIMSACMAFVFAAGKPIQENALALGTPEIFTTLPVLVVGLLGGFTTNFFWCMYLNFKNKSFNNYTNADTPLLKNYVLAAIAGTTWYFQFFFYGMGTTQMGRYEFSSWSIHMSFIIVFSNIWGLLLKEWKGTSNVTIRLVVSGILLLILSIATVGYGNYLAD